jgi:predicted DNA-binding transcriptional regulator AlpA
MIKTEPMAKPTFTIAEFVAMFGVSRSATYREIRDGKAIKLSRRTMIGATDAWLHLSR